MVLKKKASEQIFDIINHLILITLAVITIYPFLYVVFASFSNPTKLLQHGGMLLQPMGFSLKSFEMVLKYQVIYLGYLNTIFYVGVGTAINLVMTSIGAYALSRKNLMLRKPIMLLFIFTMYFNGGLIPNYLLIKSLHLYNTRWAVIIPVAISTWNLIILTTSFKSISESFIESAKIDGAPEWKVLVKVVIPLSIPVLMVIVLFYSVGHWNSWFNAMIYLRDRELYPLQLFLREILVNTNINDMIAGGGNEVEDYWITIKYATIIVSTLPILLLYPFIQKYFVKGVMIGGIKE